MTGAAAEIDDMFSRRNPDPVELGFGLHGESGALTVEACLLGVATTEQIVIELRHSTFLARE